MMGTLKNLLRNSSRREKTLVKSNKFYVKGEDKLFETTDKLKIIMKKSSLDSESTEGSFKSIISFETCCGDECDTNLHLFRHEFQDFIKPAAQDSKSESYFTYYDSDTNVEIKNKTIERVRTRTCTDGGHERNTHDTNTENRDGMFQNQFKSELKKFVMLTKKVQAEAPRNDIEIKSDRAKSEIARQYKGQRARLVNRSLIEKLSSSINRMSWHTEQLDDKETSTRIIFRNSASFQCPSNETRVFKLYKNRQQLITTSSETLHSTDINLITGGTDPNNAYWDSMNNISNQTILPVSCIDQKLKALEQNPKKKRQKRKEIKWQRNFVKTNKNLTKFVLRGRQKLNTMKERSMCRRKKTKRKVRQLRAYKREGEERRICFCRDENTRKVTKAMEHDNKQCRRPDIIITDILYLV